MFYPVDAMTASWKVICENFSSALLFMSCMILPKRGSNIEDALFELLHRPTLLKYFQSIITFYLTIIVLLIQVFHLV